MKVTMERVIDAIDNGLHAGFCRACGEDATGVEPDAVGYECEFCGEPCVEGAEMFLF